MGEAQAEDEEGCSHLDYKGTCAGCGRAEQTRQLYLAFGPLLERLTRAAEALARRHGWPPARPASEKP